MKKEQEIKIYGRELNERERAQVEAREKEKVKAKGKKILKEEYKVL